ncbi:MAG: DUF4366 domain-containing protein [Oscillospiraceae bacterium]|nr:DUF4366 domain-containing protein [Oscillospiraceae bacterium]
MNRNKVLTIIFALALCVGAMLYTGVTALAADETETLSVDEVWLTDDTLHIAVTDKNSGASQTLELKLSDYAKSGDEYITVQATDANGNKSNAVQFKNPYYTAAREDEPSAVTAAPSESVVSDGNPFTPDGTGQVLDNATDGDGKEFFTVETADGNVFFLIVDRERTSDNVYLLNAVTEDDLASLAKAGDGLSESAVPTAAPMPIVPPTPEAPATPDIPDVPVKSDGNGGAVIFIILAVLAVGGAGYYFKILRPKRQTVEDADEGEDYDEDDDDGDAGDYPDYGDEEDDE